MASWAAFMPPLRIRPGKLQFGGQRENWKWGMAVQILTDLIDLDLLIAVIYNYLQPNYHRNPEDFNIHSPFPIPH